MSPLDLQFLMNISLLKSHQKTLIQLFELVAEIRIDPFHSLEKVKLIQSILIKKIVFCEKMIKRLKGKIRDSKVSLKTHSLQRGKEEATLVKITIKKNYKRIDAYHRLLKILKDVGDALVFIYLDKWDIKPMAFKEGAGFIHDKTGFLIEKQYLEDVFNMGGIAIMNDLTNCLRYGDITVIKQNESPMICEIKKSTNSNCRTMRQKRNMEKVVDYLNLDSVDGLYASSQTFHRKPLFEKELNNIHRINELINMGSNGKDSYLEVEGGLYYVVLFGEMPVGDTLDCLKTKIKSTPIVTFINEYKYNNTAYYPFTLSIQSPTNLLRFYMGEYLILVAIDTSYLVSCFDDISMNVIFDTGDVEYGLIITEESGDVVMKVSRHFLGRLSLEFLSYRWFCRELVNRVLAIKQSHPSTASTVF